MAMTMRKQGEWTREKDFLFPRLSGQIILLTHSSFYWRNSK